MSDLDHAKEMLIMAQEDLDLIAALHHHPAFIEKLFGFHAQQAVEKALKAWLSCIHVRYPRTHNLNVLFELLKANGQTIPSEFLALDELTDFAVTKRYEAASTLDPPLDRAIILRQTERLLIHIKNIINK